jgi:hypothetical protein
MPTRSWRVVQTEVDAAVATIVRMNQEMAKPDHVVVLKAGRC